MSSSTDGISPFFLLAITEYRGMTTHPRGFTAHMSTTIRSRTSAVRLIAVWAVAFVASAVANVAVGTALRAILNLPSNFAQIAPPAIVSITLVGVAAAVIVFAIVARVVDDPVRTFTFVVAPIGLVLSWLFDVALYVTRAFPGTTGRGVVALMSLHVVAGVITVLLLRAQGLSKVSGAARQPA
jgi:hypothetical protein